MDYESLCLSLSGKHCPVHAENVASKVLSITTGFMETRTGFFQLVSAVVGLSVGVGVMTATLLLGVAALLQ
jgi:hypothetical protein